MIVGAQTGGRLLGQGLYGCTFEPAPHCAGGKVFKDIHGLPAVGKVTLEDISGELTTGMKIMRLPLASQYFALPTNSCIPETPIRDVDAASCKILKSDSQGPKSMLIMPAAGQEIYSWAKEIEVLSANYLRICKHLLEGMIIYQAEGYVHNDIHMGNILIDKMGVARFIDFGVAYRVTDVKTWADSHLGVTFRPKYVWDAPELHCWRAWKSGISLPLATQRIKENNHEYIAMEKQFASRMPLEKAMVDFFSSLDKSDGGKFIRTWGKGMDSWRIGLLFWFLWSDLIHWRSLADEDVWRHRDTIRRCIGGLTQFDPRQRWTPQRALAELDPQSRFGSMA